MESTLTREVAALSQSTAPAQIAAVMQLRVAEVIYETEDARTIVLETLDGEPLAYVPGQFITFRIPQGSGSIARSYSLSSSPHEVGLASVTVKKIPEGRGSGWMVDHVAAGMVLDVLKPAGKFVPKSLNEPLLLIAGGSGITPVMSILRSALIRGSKPITVLYANRDEGSVIFRQQLAELEEAYADRLTVHHWLETVQGRPSVATLASRFAAYADREVFVCGPGPFMNAVNDALTSVSVPAAQVHVEEFVSIEGDPFAVDEQPPVSEEDLALASEVEVVLDGESHTVVWPRNRKLLDVLLAEGIDAPFSCREGACSACACVLLEGDMEMEHNEVLDAADITEGLRLSCQSRPLTGRVKISYDG